MTPAQWMNVGLIVQYLVLAGLYLFEWQLPKALYWIGAAVISTAVLIM